MDASFLFPLSLSQSALSSSAPAAASSSSFSPSSPSRSRCRLTWQPSYMEYAYRPGFSISYFLSFLSPCHPFLLLPFSIACLLSVVVLMHWGSFVERRALTPSFPSLYSISYQQPSSRRRLLRFSSFFRAVAAAEGYGDDREKNSRSY